MKLSNKANAEQKYLNEHYNNISKIRSGIMVQFTLFQNIIIIMNY